MPNAVVELATRIVKCLSVYRIAKILTCPRSLVTGAKAPVVLFVRRRVYSDPISSLREGGLSALEAGSTIDLPLELPLLPRIRTHYH